VWGGEDTTDFMSVVFQVQPTEQPDQEFTRLRMTIELYRSRSVRKRVKLSMGLRVG
jgi:hypothetical protein